MTVKTVIFSGIYMPSHYLYRLLGCFSCPEVVPYNDTTSLMLMLYRENRKRKPKSTVGVQRDGEKNSLLSQ